MAQKEERTEVRVVCVLTKNELLYQKLRLELDGFVTLNTPSADAILTLADTDTVSAPEGAITLGRGDGCELKLPLRLGQIRELVSRVLGGDGRISLEEGERVATFHGRKIRLTEVEYSLLALLLEAGGEFVTREKILDSVWHSERNEGVINVYVHYLREKLEADGERIIISSRKYGYAIDKRYIGGCNAEDN